MSLEFQVKVHWHQVQRRLRLCRACNHFTWRSSDQCNTCGGQR